MFVALGASAIAASPVSKQDSHADLSEGGYITVPQIPDAGSNPFIDLLLPPLGQEPALPALPETVQPAGPQTPASVQEPVPTLPETKPEQKIEDSLPPSPQAPIESSPQGAAAVQPEAQGASTPPTDRTAQPNKQAPGSGKSEHENNLSSRVVSEIQSFVDIATEKPVGAFIAVLLAIGGIRGCIKAFGILHKWHSSWKGLRNNVLINAPTLQLHWLEKRDDGSVSLKMRALDVNLTPNNIFSNGAVAWVWNKALKQCTANFPLPSLIYHKLANRISLRTTGLHDADSHLQTFNKGLRNAYSSKYEDGHNAKRLGLKTMDWVDYVIPLCEVGPTGSRDVTYAVISHRDWFELGRERFDESPEKVSPHQKERMRQLRKALHEYKKSLRVLNMDPDDPNLGNPTYQGNPNKHIFPRVICSERLTPKEYRILSEANGNRRRPEQFTKPPQTETEAQPPIVVPPSASV